MYYLIRPSQQFLLDTYMDYFKSNEIYIQFFFRFLKKVIRAQVVIFFNHTGHSRCFALMLPHVTPQQGIWNVRCVKKITA